MKKQKSTSQAITSKKPYHSPTFKDEGHVNQIVNSGNLSTGTENAHSNNS